MKYSALKRYALICATSIYALSSVGTAALAQEPPAPAPGQAAPATAQPPPPTGAGAGAISPQAAAQAEAQRRRARPTPGAPSAPTPFSSPHGPRKPTPRVSPATDLPSGEIEVRLTSKDFKNIENQEITLYASKQSIERGNVDTTLTARTDMRGVARFTSQPTETDHVYDVKVSVGAARYSTGQFQFRTADMGMRVIVPIFESTSNIDGLMLLTRTLIAVIPQDNLFSIDVLYRVENYGDMSWIPEGVIFPLPEGFRAVTVKEPKADARFETEGDVGVKLAGTFAPGQHDLMFRFHLPTDGKSERTFTFPTTINTGMVRVILDASSTMELRMKGFPEPEETRNQEGQRRLIAGRDFVSEKVRAPDQVEVKISGIPTPAKGRTVAVGLAAAIALAGVAQAVSRKRPASPSRSDLSKEDRERASELLLEELIQLEQAFQQGTIGRKTHEQAKRQLLEAFARLRSEPEPDAA